MKPHGADVLRDSYEHIRTEFLNGNRGPGLAIFLRHGMREWIEVRCSCTPVIAAIEHAAPVVNPEYMPPETRSEMVSILAGLFVQKRWEATR